MKKPSQIIKENPFLLAPMDRVTDIAFRELCEKYECGYSVTELCSVEAIARGKTPIERYQRRDLSYNCVQLFGKDPDVFLEAAKIVEEQADAIDVNFGCPAPGVVGNESGAFLLSDPPLIYEIVSKLVENVSVPVTAKIRLGYKSKNYVDIAKEIERAGADLIVVHGRTANQGYSGEADWEAIKKVKENLSIPVVGNGDIKSIKDIEKIREGYADALMIGRACIGNPYLFKQMNTYFNAGKVLDSLSREEKKKLFLKYVELVGEINDKNLERIKQQSMWFIKGISGAKALRKELNEKEIRSVEEIIEMVEKL